MTVTSEIAQDQADATRDRVERTVSAPNRRFDPGAFLSEAKAWATSLLQGTQDMAMEVSSDTLALVKQNPIKTAAIGAVLAAAGVAIGLFATRARA